MYCYDWWTSFSLLYQNAIQHIFLSNIVVLHSHHIYTLHIMHIISMLIFTANVTMKVISYNNHIIFLMQLLTMKLISFKHLLCAVKCTRIILLCFLLLVAKKEKYQVGKFKNTKIKLFLCHSYYILNKIIYLKRASLF